MSLVAVSFKETGWNWESSILRYRIKNEVKNNNRAFTVALQRQNIDTCKYNAHFFIAKSCSESKTLNDIGKVHVALNMAV